MKKIISFIIPLISFNITASAYNYDTDMFEEYAKNDDVLCKTESFIIEMGKNSVFQGDFPAFCKGDYFIEIVREPENGELIVNDDRTFTYKAEKNRAYNDNFYYRISTGKISSNISGAVIKVGEKDKIAVSETKFCYADMKNNPARTAAEKMIYEDIIKGERIGKDYYFYPEKSITAEFAENAVKKAFFERIDGSDDIVSCSSKLQKADFNKNKEEELTRIDAICMIDRALNEKTETDKEISYFDKENIPDYARASVSNLMSYGILDCFGNEYLKPYEKIKKEEFVQILYDALEFTESKKEKNLAKRIKECFYGKIIT